MEPRAHMIGTPGDAVRKRGLQRMWLHMFTLGGLGGLGLGIILVHLIALSILMGFLLIFAALGMGYLYAKYQTKMAHNFFKGARGEEMVANELSRLPADWTVFNGIVLEDGHDIDHIAVGPQGIFVIETKYWSGDIEVVQGEILANGHPVNRSPIQQIRSEVQSIMDVIQLPEVNLKGVLCFIGHHFEGHLETADETLVCSHLILLPTLTQGPQLLDAHTIARCVTHLNSLKITEGLS